MSFTDNDASDNFYDLYKHLVEYEKFIPYLRSLPVQTNEMERVKMFKILKRTYRENYIICCLKLYRVFCKRDCSSPYNSHLTRMILQSKAVDTLVQPEKYYKGDLQKRNQFDMNTEYHPDAFHEYPVRIVGIKTGWMFPIKDQANIEDSRLAFM